MLLIIVEIHNLLTAVALVDDVVDDSTNNPVYHEARGANADYAGLETSGRQLSVLTSAVAQDLAVAHNVERNLHAPVCAQTNVRGSLFHLSAGIWRGWRHRIVPSMLASFHLQVEARQPDVADACSGVDAYRMSVDLCVAKRYVCVSHVAKRYGRRELVAHAGRLYAVTWDCLPAL